MFEIPQFRSELIFKVLYPDVTLKGDSQIRLISLPTKARLKLKIIGYIYGTPHLICKHILRTSDPRSYCRVNRF